MRLFDYGKLSRLMAEKDIAVILAHTQPNVEYLTDCVWVHHFNKDNFILEDGKSYYLSVVGLPQDEGKAFYMGCSTEIGYPETYGMWIQDRRYWGASFVVEGRKAQVTIADNPMARLVEVMREKGLDRGRIAVEWRHIEMFYFEQLRQALPHATFVDAEPLLWELRMVKSAEEIARMRRAARGSSDVAHLCYSTAKAGMTEWDMDALIDRALTEQGLHHEYTEIAFGPKGAGFVGATETRLEPGHILRLDIGGSYQGYQSDLSRSLAFGQVSDEAKRAHACIYNANKALREAVRPGVTGVEMFKLCMSVIEGAGYKSLTRQAGHSLGRTVHEPPFLTPDWDRPLEPGMVVNVEPTMRIQGVGSVNIEDTMLVTEDGAECLTTVPRELEAYA